MKNITCNCQTTAQLIIPFSRTPRSDPFRFSLKYELESLRRPPTSKRKHRWIEMLGQEREENQQSRQASKTIDQMFVQAKLNRKRTQSTLCRPSFRQPSEKQNIHSQVSAIQHKFIHSQALLLQELATQNFRLKELLQEQARELQSFRVQQKEWVCELRMGKSLRRQ